MDLKLIKRIQVIYVLFTLLMSFIIAPNFGKDKNFFVFFHWGLFSEQPRKSVYDITWDGGRSFLFRDHREKARDIGVNMLVFFYLTNSGKIQRGKKDYLRKLKKLGPCEKLLFVEIEGPLYRHIFSDGNFEKPTIIQEIPLCEN